MYLIVVDTTHSVTFASPLHRSIYKKSSDWSFDNRSLGHQNVSRRSFHERHKQTESEMKGLILIRLTPNWPHPSIRTSSSGVLKFANWHRCKGHFLVIVSVFLIFPCSVFRKVVKFNTMVKLTNFQPNY